MMVIIYWYLETKNNKSFEISCKQYKVGNKNKNKLKSAKRFADFNLFLFLFPTLYCLHEISKLLLFFVSKYQ